MSNIIIKERTSFLPATQAKAFKPLNVPDFIKGIFPYAPEERATPSMIKMNKGAAMVAMGGKGTPQAFITGLMYVLAAHAWGQGKADEMGKSLPAYSAEALKHGAAFLPAGKGCDALSLRSATEEAVLHMLSLPAKTKEKVIAPAIAAPVATNEVSVSEANTLIAEVWSINPPMDTDEQGKRYAGHYLRHVQARAEALSNDAEAYAIGKRMEHARMIAEESEALAVAATVSREIAAQEFRRLADFLGVNLTRAQIAKLAA